MLVTGCVWECVGVGDGVSVCGSVLVLVRVGKDLEVPVPVLQTGHAG